MVNVRRNINAGPREDLDRRLIIHHLFAFSRDDVNNLFGARVIVSGMTFSLRQFDYTKTESTCSCNGRLAQEMNLAPIKFQTIDILCRSDNSSAKFVHRERNSSST